MHVLLYGEWLRGARPSHGRGRRPAMNHTLPEIDSSQDDFSGPGPAQLPDYYESELMHREQIANECPIDVYASGGPVRMVVQVRLILRDPTECPTELSRAHCGLGCDEVRNAEWDVIEGRSH